MVLEQFLPAEVVEKRPLLSFVLGFVYSLVSIFVASLIFKSSCGQFAVAFAALLLFPIINRILLIEEKQASHEKKISFRTILRDHSDVFEVFLFMFFGIFTAFVLVSLFVKSDSLVTLFNPQLRRVGILGNVFADHELFWRIYLNNLLVLIVCFLLSIFYGAGSIVFLAWNASVWGVFFGYSARYAFAKLSPIVGFITYTLPYVPHMITEATSYLFGAFSGGIFSRALSTELLHGDYTFSKKKFIIADRKIFQDSIMFLFLSFLMVTVAAILEVYVFPLII
ncbi:stage II sporulation protein M [Candidatus Woesearchaeota archaeon]|nr:stage II sporulation protein M [Candidatus Woesearchaeota archaeon]